MNIQSLSTSERILLAEQLWESVRTQSESPAPLSQEQMELLDSRLSALEVDGDLGEPWEIVKARIANP